MMVDPFRMLGGSDPVPRSAATFNAMLRAANHVREHDADRFAERVRRTPQSSIVAVRNASLDPVARFGILGVDRSTLLPDQDEIGFATRVHLRGIKPTLSHRGRFVVLLQPLAAGEMGLGVIAGVTICRVYFPQAGYRFAEPAVDEDEPAAPLTAQAYGPAQILWADDMGKDGVAWCIVRIGNDTRGVEFKVRCFIDGGTAGSLNSTCSWTYTVRTLDDVLIATSKTPQRRRLLNTPYTPTPSGAIGCGYFNLDGEFILYDANETPQTQACQDGDESTGGEEA
jgi:hypothetical protein